MKEEKRTVVEEAREEAVEFSIDPNLQNSTFALFCSAVESF